MGNHKARVITKVAYKKTMEGVRKNVEYIGFRAREHEEEQKGFFNEKLDTGADYQRFLHGIEQHKALQHESTVKAHTMIFSLREDDYKSLVAAGGNFKDIAREIMKELEERKGMKLEWIGAFHAKSGHPHIHLSIMSVGVDEEGKNRRLRINQSDLNWLPQKLEKKLEAYVPEQKQDKSRTQALGRRRGANRINHQATKALDTLKADHDHKASSKTNQRRRRRRAKSRTEQQKQSSNQGISPQR